MEKTETTEVTHPQQDTPQKNEATETVQTEASPNEEATLPAQATPTPPKQKKHLQATAKVATAQSRIQSTNEEIEACMARVEEDLNAFKGAQTRFFNQVLHPSQQMLKAVGAKDRIFESLPAPQVDLKDDALAPVAIVKLSSGTGRGLLYGLLGGLAVVGGWCYAATQALGMPLIPETFPDVARITQSLGWVAQRMGQGNNVAVGGTIIGVSAVVVGWGVYALTKTVRGSSNLKKATQIEEDTEFYCTKKGECKAQMEKVREHIAHAQEMVEKYEVLLAEQNAALQRALYIEEADTYDQLHPHTQQTVRTIKKLTTEVERLLETPMAKHGILSKEGIEILERTHKSANDFVAELYG